MSWNLCCIALCVASFTDMTLVYSRSVFDRGGGTWWLFGVYLTGHGIDVTRMHGRPMLRSAVGSPRENYFRSAGQNVRQVFNALSDILIPCQTFFSVDNRQMLNPAGQNVWQGQSPLPDISRILCRSSRTLCRTSAELCRTCPAYFARTEMDGQILPSTLSPSLRGPLKVINLQINYWK